MTDNKQSKKAIVKATAIGIAVGVMFIVAAKLVSIALAQ